MPGPAAEKAPSSEAPRVQGTAAPSAPHGNSADTRDLFPPVDGVGTPDLSDRDHEKGDNDLGPMEGASPVPETPMPIAPNGGILAWLQVAGSFCIFLNTW